MQFSDFYTQNTTDAVEIKLVFKNEFDKQNYSAKIKNIFTSLKFSAKLGEMAIIFDDAGNLGEVYIGADISEDNYLAQVVNKLPSAKYTIKGALTENVALGWAKAQYKFTKYKIAKNSPRVLVLDNKLYLKVLAKTEACFIVRNLINTPAADMGPQEMADVLGDIASRHSAEFKQITGNDLLKKNFPAIYTVGKGSSSESRLLELNWGDNKHPKVTLIGKGVCFDSGLSLIHI